MAAAGVTWTSIANLALARIREQRLDSIDDTTKTAGLIRDLRPIAACEVLEMHDWGSATARVKLSSKAGDPVGPWSEHFGLPNDLVRITAIWPFTTSNGTDTHGGPYIDDWKLEGDTLYVGRRDSISPMVISSSGGDNFAISYVRYKESDIGLWSPGLRRCIALRIAADLAVMTVGDTTLQDKLDGDFERQLRRAQTLDTSREGNALHEYANHDHRMPLHGYSNLVTVS